MNFLPSDRVAHRVVGRGIFGLCVIALLSGCAAVKKAPGLNMLFGDEEQLGGAAADPTQEAGVDYEIAVVGLGLAETDEQTAENVRMLGVIEGAARIYKLQDKPPPNIALLKRRAAADVDLVERALRSEGYFEGEASIRVNDDNPEAPIVNVNVRKGPRYALARQQVEFDQPVSAETIERVNDAASSGVSGPAEGRVIVGGEADALAQLTRAGRPYAKRGKRRAEANFDHDTLDVTTQIATGPYTVYGPVSIEGLETVDRDYVEGFVSWATGAPVSTVEISAVQRKLASTRLFDAVSVKLPDAPPEDLAVGETFEAPVIITLEEAKHRTATAGLSYSTTDGAGGRLSWENRNLRGRNETVKGTLTLSQTRQSLRFDGRIPRYRKPERDLVGSFEGFREETEAFDTLGVEAGIGIEERYSDNLSYTLGVALEAAQTTEDGIERNSYLLGLPGTLRYDDTDNLLNPTEGFRANAHIAPWFGTFDDEGTAFFVTDLEGSTYLSLDRRSKYVLALRSRAAAVFAESRSRVPPRRRLYSGGGGSVRAYRNQFVNPLDAQNDPVGALSVIEGSAELRMRFGSFGVVPFIDGGSVSQELFSEFGKLRWGGGLGLRYFSPVGPIRVDVAVPFDRRSEDDAYQLYLSIGQAF